MFLWARLPDRYLRYPHYYPIIDQLKSTLKWGMAILKAPKTTDAFTSRPPKWDPIKSHSFTIKPHMINCEYTADFQRLLTYLVVHPTYPWLQLQVGEVGFLHYPPLTKPGWSNLLRIRWMKHQVYTPRVHSREACFTTYLRLWFWGLWPT